MWIYLRIQLVNRVAMFVSLRMVSCKESYIQSYPINIKEKKN